MEEKIAHLRYCQSLPKIELHAHLNGSIRDDTLRELAMAEDSTVDLLMEDVIKLTNRGDRSLGECFKLFDLIHKVTSHHDVITRITREVLEDFAADNVVYVELRTTPKNNSRAGMTKESYVDAVIKGMEMYAKSEEVGLSPRRVLARLILSIDRRESSADAIATVQLAAKMRSRGVVGVDLSGNPNLGEWQTFEPALQLARELGLKLTLHCGEVENSAEVQAMLAFRPERLGHCCTLNHSEMETLRVAQIPVELCLTSNVKTESTQEYSDHHFQDMYEKNMPVVLCTDDSGVFSTTLSREYALAAAAFGLDESALMNLSQSAIGFVFDTSPELISHLQDCFFQFQKDIQAA
mmetsp:Transcript_26097/g.49276  ORF Transcript_26097/g.49276 Transcript_26097/m.49276 type:complete len:351 (-) Transcript_26097:333-1385(-)